MEDTVPETTKEHFNQTDFEGLGSTGATSIVKRHPLDGPSRDEQTMRESRLSVLLCSLNNLPCREKSQVP